MAILPWIFHAAHLTIFFPVVSHCDGGKPIPRKAMSSITLLFTWSFKSFSVLNCDTTEIIISYPLLFKYQQHVRDWTWWKRLCVKKPSSRKASRPVALFHQTVKHRWFICLCRSRAVATQHNFNTFILKRQKHPDKLASFQHQVLTDLSTRQARPRIQNFKYVPHIW